MLNDTTAFKKIYIATGYTDLRQGIDGLASHIKFHFELDPFDKDTLFLFCGRRATKIKGLVWEADVSFCISDWKSVLFHGRAIRMRL